MFAYETVDNSRLRLLSSVPAEWFSKGFSAKNLGTAEGNLDIIYDKEMLTVQFSKPASKTVEIVFGNFDRISLNNVIEGKEYVDRITNNVIILKPGISKAALRVK